MLELEVVVTRIVMQTFAVQNVLKNSIPKGDISLPKLRYRKRVTNPTYTYFGWLRCVKKFTEKEISDLFGKDDSDLQKEYLEYLKEKEHNDCNFDSLKISNNNIYGHMRFDYNTESHLISIPNMSWIIDFIGRNPQEKDLNFRKVVYSFTHEYIHKLLHEFINTNACHQWDNIDKTKNNKCFVFSCM